MMREALGFELPAKARAMELEEPPEVARWMLYGLMAMVGLLLLWAVIGRLDIVAVAQGKLVPTTYVKIVQPADAGIVKDILVGEGQAVRVGQVLMRMDPALGRADQAALLAEYHLKDLGIRRIDAELVGQELAWRSGDPEAAYAQAVAQHRADRQALESALAGERSQLDKARHDLTAAEEVRAKLEKILPHYRDQEQAYDDLAKRGFMGKLLANEKTRERIEQEQNLRAQDAVMHAARAEIERSERQLTRIQADYGMRLRAERQEAVADLEKLRQELAKQAHRNNLLELRAPQDGVVKDLATHTVGTVVSPGTILMTLVPNQETLRAEVWVSNEDIGFVRQGQPVQLKFTSFQFQKYGMLKGRVARVGADAARSRDERESDAPVGPLVYRTLVDLERANIEVEGNQYPLIAGMQVVAEVHLGERTVMEYLLSPLRKAFHEAGRER